MNKLKLFAATLLLGIGGNAAAQTDVTATYIQNPGFEDCEANTVNLSTAKEAGVDYTAQGWTITATGSYCNAAAFEYGSSTTFNSVTAPIKP